MNRKPKPQSSDWRRNYAVIVGIGLVFSGGAYAIYSVVSDGGAPKKRVMETIALKIIPPPPPPPAPPPPPPPPKLVEPQKIEPPIDKPDDRPKDEPQPGPLALDAQGGPGGDAFGLGGKPGGADFVLGGGGGGGNRYGHYANLMQEQIGKRLRQDDQLDAARFRATIRVWLSPVGRVERVEVARTTGDGQLDDRIKQMIGTMPLLPEAPPQEMPQPVVVRIGATPGFG